MAPLSVDRFKKSTNETTDEHRTAQPQPKSLIAEKDLANDQWQMTNEK